MEWWTHLWLNEGLATWIEYLCVDHTHPEFEIWTNFLSREYASALNLDALDNSHPIEVSRLLGLCLVYSNTIYIVIGSKVEEDRQSQKVLIIIILLY